MVPIALFGIRIEKDLFGKYDKTYGNPQFADLLDRNPFPDPENLVNVYGEGFFEPYTYCTLFNKDLFYRLIVLDAEKYCYKVKLGEIIVINRNSHVADFHINSNNMTDNHLEFHDKVDEDYAIVFGYSLPKNHEELDFCIHKENGQLLFYIPYGLTSEVIKFSPLAIIIPKSEKVLMDKYVNFPKQR
jgi:hypothetical protein